MILDYDKPVDFSNNKSLRRFRRWMSYKIANFTGIIEYKKDTDQYFDSPESRTLARDYYEAVQNIDLVKHWHWAINEIIKVNENESRIRRTNKEDS